jgi:DNA-binding winged helix-turn-helix (wHTH) protein/tetratricopeptide (TPR) repeat protein
MTLLAHGRPVVHIRSVIFAFDDFELDAERRQLRRAGRSIKVESSALRLLLALVRRSGQLLSKDDLLQEVWEGRAVAENVITVAMTRLRKALLGGRGGKEFVATVYGRGYRFTRPVVVRRESAAPCAAHDGSRPGELPFVGREQVLTRLRHALAEACAGRGRLCVLMGEPGIGKTRAVEMLERELVASPVGVAWGYCREAGETPPLWPWQELLDEISGGATGQRLVESGAAKPEGTEHFHFTDAPMGTAQVGAADAELYGTARQRAFQSILRSFIRATEQTPWLLVLEDLQRADAASLELLGHLVERVADTQILLVATLRSGAPASPDRAATPLPRILEHRDCERIMLERLQPRDVAGYVGALLEDPEQELARAVYAKSEGNPFFMAELLRQLRDASDPHAEALAVPAAALDLVRQRVANLDVGVRGLLSTCAVIGRSFELCVLTELMERDESALMLGVDVALRAEILIRVAGSRTAFSFSHELIRAALYQALSPAQRRLQHRRVGEALERRRAAGDAIAASELAYHFYAGLPISDLRKTVQVCREAAEAAAAVFAYPDVVRFTRQALEALLLMDRPSVRLRMNLLYLTAIYARSHDPAGYAQCVAELVHLGRERASGEMLVRAGALLNAHPGLPPLLSAGAVMEEGLRLLPERCLGLRALGCAGLSAASPHCYLAERSEALAEQAVALARAADSSGAISVALLNQLYLIGGPAQQRRATEIAGQLEQLARNNPVALAVLPVDLAFHRANHALICGEPQLARTAMEQAAARSRELHHGELLWHSERALALMQVDCGESALGHAALLALHARAAHAGLLGSAVFCAYDKAVVLGRSLQELARDDSLRRALQYQADDAPGFWALKVQALVAAGMHEEARAALRTVAPARLSSLPCDSHYLGTLGHLTRAVVLLSESSYFAALQALLERYPDHFATQLFCASAGAVELLLGMLAHAAGHRREAIEHLPRAIDRNERAGLAAHAAEARALLARCLLEQGDGLAAHMRGAPQAQAAAGDQLAFRRDRDAAAPRRRR